MKVVKIYWSCYNINDVRINVNVDKYKYVWVLGSVIKRLIPTAITVMMASRLIKQSYT